MPSELDEGVRDRGHSQVAVPYQQRVIAGPDPNELTLPGSGGPSRQDEHLLGPCTDDRQPEQGASIGRNIEGHTATRSLDSTPVPRREWGLWKPVQNAKPLG